MDKGKLHFWLIVIVAILSYAIVGVVLQNQWFGTNVRGVEKFCELAHKGIIIQPSNAFSSFIFTIIGIIISFQAFKRKFTNNNLINNDNRYTFILSLALLGTGAGSFAMHASFTDLSGFGDLFGMYMISAFMFMYPISRIFKLSFFKFFVFFVAIITINSYVYFSPLNFKADILTGCEIAFLTPLILGIILELYLMFKKKIVIVKSLAFLALVTSLLSFLIWNLSLYDNILCDPESILQGHALWHILDAIAVYLVYRYYVSEKSDKNF